MDVAVTGASGLVGTALSESLIADGHRVIRLIRGARAPEGALAWDPMAGAIDARGLEGIDAVVHLAGEGIAEKKWTPEQKARIRDSRSKGTGTLARALAELDKKPAVLVSGSAVGWYGNRGDEELTESSASPASPDFLSEVCVAWEGATKPAQDAGIRTVHVRTGMVLAAHGGALQRMLMPFKMGLGGRIGSGSQYMSWISLDDEVGAIRYALDTPALDGPINATGPAPVTNAEFTKALGAALHRPTLLPTPVAPLKAVFGSELVQHLLLDGQRVLPDALERAGFRHRHPTLAAALAAVVNTRPRR
jgi:uncharacterized protein (TIGR01777 family)